MSGPHPHSFDGARVTVAGLGLFGGGLGSARWFKARGARVLGTDLRDAETLAPTLLELEGHVDELVLGEHREQDFTHADLVLVNPAVPASSPLLGAAREAGVPVVTEAEMFLRHTSAEPILVSGTHGKSSTCTFTHQLLEHAAELSQASGAEGRRARLGGNMGISLLGAFDDIERAHTVVVELSSYQLEHLTQDPPAVAGLAALTPIGVDHLERHGSEAGYHRAKRRLWELLRPAGTAVGPAGFLPAASHAQVELPPPGSGRGRVQWESRGEVRLDGVVLGSLAVVPLPGSFQRENAARAAVLAALAGARPEQIASGLEELRGLPHRLDLLGEHDGRPVIDNGVSTTPESTLAALRALAEDGPPGGTLLIGGQAKEGVDYAALADACGAERADETWRVICFGRDAGRLAEHFAALPHTSAHASLDEAVPCALEETPHGARILFSPACASFDSYPNFAARALHFRELLSPELG